MSRLDISLMILIGALMLQTLSAYNIGPIPLPWLSTVLFLISSIPFIKKGKLIFPSCIFAIIVYLAVSVQALLVHNIFSGVPDVPSQASTNYVIYIILRIIGVMSYISAMVATYNLVLRGKLNLIIRSYIFLTAFVVMSASYIYLAQKIGLWEPLRTRTGTGGQDFTTSSVEFHYLFHRATGTFLEPSHLAGWLAPALIFILPQTERFRAILGRVLLIGSTLIIILLSGSFMGVIGLSVGYIVLLGKSGKFLLSRLVKSLLVVVILIWIGVLFLEVDILAALLPRMETLFQEGVAGTNRAYIYEYFLNYPPPILGQGIGNGALLFTKESNEVLIASIINLFLGVWYDSGVLGLISVLTFFAWPFIIFFKLRLGLRDPVIAGCLAAHVTWMVEYFGMIPEFSAVHAVILGIFFGHIRLRCVCGRNRVPSATPVY